MHDPIHSAPPWLPKASEPADEPITRLTRPGGDTPAADPAPGHAAQDQPGQEPATGGESPAVLKFRSCRWRKKDTPEHCGHPEVLPFAGTNGFTAESWCPDCQFYKLRRILPRREY
jgi:hypothetical protein